jgi:hypothetical protein
MMPAKQLTDEDIEECIRTLAGVRQGYLQIAERVVNGELRANEAREATRALDEKVQQANLVIRRAKSERIPPRK